MFTKLLFLISLLTISLNLSAKEAPCVQEMSNLLEAYKLASKGTPLENNKIIVRLENYDKNPTYLELQDFSMTYTPKEKWNGATTTIVMYNSAEKKCYLYDE